MSETIKPTILFKRPETIDAVVEFPLPDGTTAKLACKFKYRTKKEFGALWDEIVKTLTDAAKTEGESKAEEANESVKETVSIEAIFDRGNETAAKNTLRYLAAWPADLPPLTEANLEQLFDEAPASSNAIWNAYRNLCTTGVAGN